MTSGPWRAMTAVDPSASKICLSCEGVSTSDVDRCAHCGVPLVATTAVHFPLRRGESDAANPLVGTVLGGKFALQGVLGKGGMGTVFRARHAVSMAPLALKLLHPRLSSRAEFRRILLAEARKAGRVVDEHCARVFDVGETDDGTVYLAMELAEGEPIDAWVRRGRIAPAVALDILVQVCRALVAIHATGLVHRDLSSRNVLVAVRAGRPFVKVLDFGIAQTRRLPASAKGDSAEALFANPVFSAPEHLAGGDVDARADLYSLGALAQFLLTGALPVTERDPRAAARRTVAGELDPMPAVPGVPRRFARFVERCLSRDPEQRPASAEAALAELEAIRGGARRWLARASLVVAASSLALAIFVFARATQPFLRVVGGALALREGVPTESEPAAFMHPRALRTVRANFGGFAPQLLELEVTKSNTLQWRSRLAPVVEGEGALVLSDDQPAWRDAIQRIERASADGPVDLAFVVPGAALLGSARVRLDDAPPEMGLALEGTDPAGAVRLLASTRARIAVSERTGLASLQLVLELARGERHEVELPPDARDGALAAAFTGSLPPSAPHGPGVLTVVGVDLAGNRGASPALAFEECDFGAPTVEDVAGPDGESSVPFLEGRAVVRLRIAFEEPGITVEVRDDSGRVRGQGPLRKKAGAWHELDLAAAPDGEPFAPGLFSFAVVDAAGNRAERSLPLSFRSRRLDAVFTAESAGRAAVLGKELVCGPDGGEFAFTCGQSFAPIAVALRQQGSEEPLQLAKAVLSAEGSRHRVAVPPLRAGRYELALELEERGGRSLGAVQFSMPLAALPGSLQLRMPASRSRYLPALLSANALRLDAGFVRDGAGVSVEGGFARFVRGALWHGPDPQSLVATPLPMVPSVEGALLPPVPLLRGRNVLALELRDALGRPVVAAFADGSEVPLTQGRVVLADFFADPSPPRPASEAFLVEHGQPARLRVRSPLPFSIEDRESLRLSIQGADMAAVDVRRVGGESELAVVAPFAAWREGAGFAAVDAAAFERGLVAELPAQVSTPAGDHAVRFVLRTARTTLRSFRLSELAAEAPAPALGSMEMVPVLAPDEGTWPDPFPEDRWIRGRYRQLVSEPVRAMGDWFVQDREVTLAQYLALVVFAMQADPSRIVHREDPLGARRLQVESMLPRAFADLAALRTAAAEEPDSAVAGVDFYQAYAASRLLGDALFGDPGLFRLPLGCELEVAAFGTQPRRAARNGATARGRVSSLPWRRPQLASSQHGGVPSTTLASFGDRVLGAVDGEITGLDFGLREWVLDLPQGQDAASETLVREWISDRSLHEQRALELAGARPAPVDLQARLPSELRARLSTFGVVRGLSCAEPAGLLGDDGATIDPTKFESLPASVPGVLRAEQARRDGRDLLPGREDPRLRHTGFRVVGGSAFVQKVRER